MIHTHIMIVNYILYIHFNWEIHRQHFSTAPASQRMKYLGAPSKDIQQLHVWNMYLQTFTPRWPSFVYIYIYYLILYIIYIYTNYIIYIYIIRGKDGHHFYGIPEALAMTPVTTFQPLNRSSLEVRNRHGSTGWSSKIQHGKSFTPGCGSKWKTINGTTNVNV